MRGDIRASAEILDRIEGKARQSIELSGPDAGAIPAAGGQTIEEIHEKLSEYAAFIVANLASVGVEIPQEVMEAAMGFGAAGRKSRLESQATAIQTPIETPPERVV